MIWQAVNPEKAMDGPAPHPKHYQASHKLSITKGTWEGVIIAKWWSGRVEGEAGPWTELRSWWGLSVCLGESRLSISYWTKTFKAKNILRQVTDQFFFFFFFFAHFLHLSNKQDGFCPFIIGFCLSLLLRWLSKIIIWNVFRSRSKHISSISYFTILWRSKLPLVSLHISLVSGEYP